MIWPGSEGKENGANYNNKIIRGAIYSSDSKLLISWTLKQQKYPASLDRSLISLEKELDYPRPTEKIFLNISF